MNKYSETSKERLLECDERLQKLFRYVLPLCDHTILVGHRGEESQMQAYMEGASKLKWPQSKHNQEPSLAVDVAPWPIRWDDRDQFMYFGGLVMGMASAMKLPIRWGGDWNRNGRIADQTFYDLVHFEIYE